MDDVLLAFAMLKQEDVTLRGLGLVSQQRGDLAGLSSSTLMLETNCPLYPNL